MIVGFNHNVTYRGVCFHVQTEDSGVKQPHLITLLYHGGTIISSQKTSYADILNVDNLEAVVEDLAKDQHKGMLRKLKNGEFDQRIIDFGIGIKPQESAAVPAVESAPEPEVKEPEVVEEVAPVQEAAPAPEIVESATSEGSGSEESRVSTDLDDLIFSYLSGDDGKE